MPHRQLNEHEVGFDPISIGFPSIFGCLAVVLVTENGLFGYHNAGGSAADKWKKRAAAFKEFVDGHFLRGDKKTRLYGVSFVDTHRGYSSPARTSWKNEMFTFAHELGYAGKIRGFNLSTAGLPGSAYVQMRRAEGKCEIWIKAWSDADRTKNPNINRMHHKMIHIGGGIDVTVKDTTTASVVTDVTTAGLRHATPEKLRG